MSRHWVRFALPFLVAAALVASWWLSLILLIESSIVDVTPPELVVMVGGIVALATRPWRWLSRREVPFVVLLGTYLAWFPLAALLRGTTDDLKTAAAYVVFAGLAAGAAYASGRLEPGRTARILVIVAIAAVVVSFAAALLERVTYPQPGAADPLEALWSFFRPRVGFDDPRLGYIEPPPLHSSTGEPGVVRATGFFVQTNYLAFFGVLLVPLLAILLARSLRTGRGARAIAVAVVLTAALVTTYWTYARVGIVAVGVVAVAALVVEWLSARSGREAAPAGAELRPGFAVVGLVALVMVGSLLSDGVGLSRLTGTTLGEAPPPAAPGTPGEPAGEAAGRSGQIRFELQRTAVEMVSADVRSAVVGPGLAAYETAVHDPASPRHLPEARFIRDPNSLWLTVALAGGVIGVALLMTLLGTLVVRLARSLRRPADEAAHLVILWLAAWLPVWAVVQLLGTNPFNTSESIIFGTLVGLAAGLTARSDAGTVDRGTELPVTAG